MIRQLAIVAIGGNSLIEDPARPDIEAQWHAARKTCDLIAQMVVKGWAIIVTHGNGPQVGYSLERVEIAARAGVHTLPLDSVVAQTQATIGYMLQQGLDDALRRLGINRTCATVITQVRVDADDPAFESPSKPIGGFMTEAEAQARMAQGWQVREDSGRGWRRVVPSPAPRSIQEINAIMSLMQRGYVVIACGGGGIPVVRQPDGSLRGIDAVIDKDHASALLALTLRADLLLISTAVEHVMLDYGKPQQRAVARLSIAEARQHIAEGQFGKGSMLPKIEAAVSFIQNGGPRTIITNPDNLIRALDGKTGTWIVPG